MLLLSVLAVAVTALSAKDPHLAVSAASEHSVPTVSGPNVEGRDVLMRHDESPLTWPIQQQVMYQTFSHAVVKTLNDYLESHPEFEAKCLPQADCSLAVAGIQDEVGNVMRTSRTSMKLDKQCDNTCFIKQLDQGSSRVARNALIRIALIRKAIMGSSILDDEDAAKRIATFSSMMTKPHFGEHSEEKFKDALKHYKALVHTPTIGSNQIPHNTTFLEELLYFQTCTGDEFLCSTHEILLTHTVALLHAGMAPGVLHERSILREILVAANRGTLSKPGQSWAGLEMINHDVFEDGNWMPEARRAVDEITESMDLQTRAVADMSTTAFYYTESFNALIGRMVTVTLIMDTHGTFALDPALYEQGYRVYFNFFGGHPFVRLSGSLKPTTGATWQYLRPEADTVAKRSVVGNGTDPNTTASITANNTANNTANGTVILNQPAAGTRLIMPVNEAAPLRGSLRGKDMPAFYPTDDRHNPKRVAFQIRSGGKAGEHMDSLGRPIMRASPMDSGEHAPVMVSGDSLPVRDSPFLQMYYSLPLPKGCNATDCQQPKKPFDVNDPSAGYQESDGPVGAEEAFVTAVRVQPEFLFKTSHGFSWGQALYVIDGSPLAKNLKDKAVKDQVKNWVREKVRELTGEAKRLEAEDFAKAQELIREAEKIETAKLAEAEKLMRESNLSKGGKLLNGDAVHPGGKSIKGDPNGKQVEFEETTKHTLDSDSMRTLPDEAPSYAENARVWEEMAKPWRWLPEDVQKHVKLSREKAIQNAKEAGYEPQKPPTGNPGEGGPPGVDGGGDPVSPPPGGEPNPLPEALPEVLPEIGAPADAIAADVAAGEAAEVASFVSTIASESVEEGAVVAGSLGEMMGGALAGLIGEVSAVLGPIGWAVTGAMLLVTVIEMLEDEERCPHPARFTSTWDAAAQSMTDYQLPCSSVPSGMQMGDPTQRSKFFDLFYLGNPLMHSMIVPATETTEGDTIAQRTPTTFDTSTITGLTVVNNATWIVIATNSSIQLAPLPPAATVTVLIDTGGGPASPANNSATSTSTKPIPCPTTHYPHGFVGTRVAPAPCPVQTPYECTDDWFHTHVNKHLPDDVRFPNYCSSGDATGHYRAEEKGCLPDFWLEADGHHERKKRDKCKDAFLDTPNQPVYSG
ncbi:hypothetical protein TI39_contig428g00009 [Zymoseptoria brevis]|uniref:Uncharacterized protein n=1 Tax=Zymoseptoria brevis TaxID=1047168 RepID=A0A0F4GLS3_9PEZI|nr:hypothetical protein TI39_contig428g00009 [Zymoseptoria brevis]